jgi:hypothetical protein
MPTANFAYINSCNQPLPNGTVVLTPVQNPVVSGSAIAVGDQIYTTTDLQGSASFSNIVLPNYFKLDFKVVRDTTTFYCYLPTSSLDLNGADYSVSCSIQNGDPTSVYFSLVDCTGHSWAVKNVVLSPIYYPNVNDSRITTRDEITLPTDLNGTVTFPTVIPNTYMVTCNGHRRSTVFFIQVPPYSGSVNAKDIMVLPTAQQLQVINIPPASFATGLTQAEADLLYQTIIQSGSYFNIFVANATTADTASYVTVAQTSISSSYSDFAITAINADSSSTSLFAVNADTASVALSSSYAGFADTASISYSSSYSPFADTASYVQLAESSSFALFADTASYAVSASVADTASYAFNAVSASYAPVDLTNVGSASFASSSLTASLADTASQALYADASTSASYSPFADFATSASVAGFSTSASVANSASYSQLAISASYAFSASNAVSASVANSASYSPVADFATNAFSASVAGTASIADSASYSPFADVSTSASYAATASVALNIPLTASNADTASFAFNANSASYSVSSSFSPGSISSSYSNTASYAFTASMALNVPDTASYAFNAVSASYAFNATSASFAVSYSYTFVTINQQSSSFASSSVSSSYSLYADTASHAFVLRTDPTLRWEPVFVGPDLLLTDGASATGGGAIFIDTNGNKYFGVVAVDATPLTFYSASLFEGDVTINGHTYGQDADFNGILFGNQIFTNIETFNGFGGAVTIENDNNGGFLFTVGGAHQVQIDKWGNISGSNLFGSASFSNSSSYALTASVALNVGSTVSASHAAYADSASYALTASVALNAGPTVSASFADTASYSFEALHAETASFAISSSVITIVSESSSFASASISSSYALLALSASFAKFAQVANTAFNLDLTDVTTDNSPYEVLLWDATPLYGNDQALTYNPFTRTMQVTASQAISASHALVSDRIYTEEAAILGDLYPALFTTNGPSNELIWNTSTVRINPGAGRLTATEVSTSLLTGTASYALTASFAMNGAMGGTASFATSSLTASVIFNSSASIDSSGNATLSALNVYSSTPTHTTLGIVGGSDSYIVIDKDTGLTFNGVGTGALSFYSAPARFFDDVYFNGNVFGLPVQPTASYALTSSTTVDGINAGLAFQSPGIYTNSLQLGTGSTATGQFDIVVGPFARSINAYGANDNIVIGHTATTSNTRDISIGHGTVCLGSSSIAIGYNASAAGNNAIAIGTSVSVPEDNTVRFGDSHQTVVIDGILKATGSLAAIYTVDPVTSTQVATKNYVDNRQAVTSSISASHANQADTASYVNAVNVIGVVASASYALTASFALNGGGTGGTDILQVQIFS